MHPQVLILQGAPQIEQRTDEWYEARKKLITASEAASVLKKTEPVCREYIEAYKGCPGFSCEIERGSCNPYQSERDFFLRKHGKKHFSGSFATSWGQRFEPIATGIYELQKRCHITEYGLLVHPDLPWLGASPDGITDAGVLLEIKCPYQRQYKDYPPFIYWIQCQLQMEVCNLDQCDFMECDFVEYGGSECFLADTLDEGQFKGVVLIDADGVPVYYPTVVDTGSYAKMVEWAQCTAKENWRVIYWKLLRSQIIVIPRAVAWFQRVQPLLHRGYRRMMAFDASNVPDELTFIPLNEVDLSSYVPKAPHYTDIEFPDLCGDD